MQKTPYYRILQVPVSYTHLDVYKRQVKNFAEIDYDITDSEDYEDPVSDTHLDVYKRQFLWLLRHGLLRL